MKKFIIGLIVGLMISSVAYGYRFGKPQRITDYDDRGLIILNEALEQLWDAVNGRYTLNVETTNPDGSLSGDKGDMVLYDAGATEYLEINVDGGTTWKGVQITDTP